MRTKRMRDSIPNITPILVVVFDEDDVIIRDKGIDIFYRDFPKRFEIFSDQYGEDIIYDTTRADAGLWPGIQDVNPNDSFEIEMYPVNGLKETGVYEVDYPIYSII